MKTFFTALGVFAVIALMLAIIGGVFIIQSMGF